MEAVVCHFRNWSPDLRETLVSCLGHSTLFEHVVTDVTEDLKLLNAGQGVSILTFFHDLEHVCFVGDHGPFRLLCNYRASINGFDSPCDTSSPAHRSVAISV